MVEQKWKIIDNQNLADVMVEVYGKNEEDLMSNILGIFTDIITERDELKDEIEKTVKISGKNLPDLILNFINKLIYLKDTAFMIFRNGKHNLTFTQRGYSLNSILSGQKISKDLAIKTDIKALALHKFKIQKIKNRYKVSLVFDI